MKRFRLGILLALLAALLLGATPVYADTPDPDSTPTIDEINIYHNYKIMINVWSPSFINKGDSITCNTIIFNRADTEEF